MEYQAALEQAQKTSVAQHCTQHVNAVLGKDADGTPCITGYVVSDWCDGSTVATFVEGWLR
jgi:hypothetical protein